MRKEMGRKVSRINTCTVISNVITGKRTKFWVSGLKVDKWALGDDQYFDIKYAVPQEIEMVLIERKNNNHFIDKSISSLETHDFILPDGRKISLKGWELFRYGVRFFDTQENAEKYFIEKTHILFGYINPIEKLYSNLYKKIEYTDPNFIELINQ